MKKHSVLSFAFSTLFLFSCSDENKNNSGFVAQGSSVNKSATVSVGNGAATLGDGITTDGHKVAEGYGMTWSETTADEVIPALPIFGFANGLPFNAGTVVFRQDHKGAWFLEISDHKFDPVKGIAFGRIEKKDLQTVYINLPEAPAAGSTFNREMDYGGGYFQIKKSADSQDTTSWNTSMSYKIEIEKWEMGESVVGSCGVPAMGRATGKVFASFKGSTEAGRIRNSWISGQFVDAAILYCGK